MLNLRRDAVVKRVYGLRVQCYLMMIVPRFGMGIRVFMAVMFSLVLGAIYSERNTNQKSIQVSQCSQQDKT